MVINHSREGAADESPTPGPVEDQLDAQTRPRERAKASMEASAKLRARTRMGPLIFLRQRDGQVVILQGNPGSL